VIDRPDGSLDGPPEPTDEPRQRWRIVFARDAATRDTTLVAGTRDAPSEAAAWATALGLAGLPIARTLGKTPRPRLTFAAPLAVGMSGEAELADLVLTERLPIADVRSRLASHLPEGHRLVDLYDVWLGAPALAAQLASADYRVVVRRASAPELADACATLMAAVSLERSRQKGDGRAVVYDLRPLLSALSVIPPATDGAGVAPSPAETSLRMRLRQVQDGTSGRPDEVVLALGEALGRSLELGPLVRERLLTADLLEGA
jgi:radical SAM-linked protein